MNPAFNNVIADPEGRRELFLGTALRLGTTAQNIEKDFWVCWTLDALFCGLKPGGPRLLFKGGTSLSKGFGLIARFSEDIDITVFRDDLGSFGKPEDWIALSAKKRAAHIDAIKAACQVYIQQTLRQELADIAAQAMKDVGSSSDLLRVHIDEGDPDLQSLLLWYPSVVADKTAYVQPAVKIESGARSALDPHAPVTIQPYVSKDLPSTLDLSVPGVITIDPRRTFWDKVILLHGLRRWYERRHELRGGGQRVSRHYYDLHQLLLSPIGLEALQDHALAFACVQHARIFFNRPDLNLATAAPGTFALVPHPDMLTELRRDYTAMTTMIFGVVPSFEVVMTSIQRLEESVNRSPSS
jgi:hypothetical protein